MGSIAHPAPLSAALDPSTISQVLTRLAAAALLLSILAAGRVAVAGEDCAPPALTAGTSAALHARMEAALPRHMDAFAVPGTALALIEQGRVRYTRGFGFAEPANARSRHSRLCSCVGR